MFVLQNGINIQNLDFKTFHIDELYIKLDKKLIFVTKNVEIKKQITSGEDKIDILSLGKKIKLLDVIFSRIAIENLHYGDLRFDMMFENNMFFVDMPYFRMNMLVDTKDDKIVVDVKELVFKDFNATFVGVGTFDTKSGEYDFSGNFSSYELNGNLMLKVQNEKLYYNLFDVKADGLEKFLQKIEDNKWLDEEVKEWIYGNVVAKNYFIKNLNGMFDLKTKNAYLNDIQGSASAKNLKVKFHKDVEPVYVDDANVTLKNGVLDFELNNPKYYEKSLVGSKIVIKDLFGKNANVNINIKTNSMLDDKIHEILKAYDIKVPVTQKSGKLKTDLLLSIRFKDSKVNVNGKFELENSNIVLSNSPFYSKHASIILENASIVKLKNSHLSNSFLDVNTINGEIFINEDRGSFDGIANLNLQIDQHNKKNAIVIVEQKPVHLDMKFKNDSTTLDIAEFATKVVLSTPNVISIKKLSDVIEYSPLLKNVGLKGGDNVEIKTDDFENFMIYAQNLAFDLPFIKKDGLKYDNDSFEFEVLKDRVKGVAKSDLFSFLYQNSLLSLNFKDLDFVYNDSLNDNNKNEEKLDLKIDAQNSNIILTDSNKTIPFDSYHGDIKGKDIELFAKKDSGDFYLRSTPHKLALDATNLSGDFINKLFKTKSFEKGMFNLHLLGRNPKNYNAEIIVTDTHLTDYVFYHQLLTFINTVPSLLIFKTPDFNQNGFTVKNGKIYFSRNGEVLNFKAINLTGTSADLGGRGVINLQTTQIDIDLELKVLKDASSIIGKIPLVNQIILGKDRTLSTVIKVFGTLDNPQYETQLLQDALTTPFNIIKNTLELPFVIFE